MMIRRRLHAVWVLSALMGIMPVKTSAGEQPAPRPNIVFIMVDDMGDRNPGCFGGKSIKTPHIDKMCAEGIKFTDCYSGDSVCAPARSTLMTGMVSKTTLEHLKMFPDTAKEFAALFDKNGNPVELDDVFVSQWKGKDSGKLAPRFGGGKGVRFGPDYPFGVYMHQALNEPILIITRPPRAAR